MLLFIMPIAAACVPLVTVDVIVPRDSPEWVADLSAPLKFGASTMASLYDLAIAGAILAVFCVAAVLCYAFMIAWIAKRSMFARERKYLNVAAILAFGFPVILLAVQLSLPVTCNRLGIDDCVTRHLLDATIGQKYHTTFAMHHDSEVLAYLIFTSFLLAVLTAAALSSSSIPPDKERSSEHIEMISAEERWFMLNMVLFVTAAALVLATIVARLRFNVGLTTIDSTGAKDAAASARQAYQTVVSAIMIYWTSILSLCLALLYVPNAVVLALGEKGGIVSAPVTFLRYLTRDGFLRALKVFAVVSPPLVSKVADLLQSS